MLRPGFYPLALALSAFATLSACQAHPPAAGTGALAVAFRMQALGETSTTVSTPLGASVHPAADQAPEAAPAVDAPTAATSTDVAKGAGQLTVHFDQVVSTRSWRLLALPADLDQVVVHLVGAGVDVRVTVPKSALAGGTTSHTFTGLPDGDFVVTVEVLDVAGKVIGRDVKRAKVAAGQPAAVSSEVALAPSVAAPNALAGGRSSRRPSTGSQVAGRGATGGLAMSLGFLEFPAARQPDIVATYLSDGGITDFYDLAVHGDGSVWVATGSAVGSPLYRVALNGDVTQVAASGAGRVDASDPTGVVHVLPFTPSGGAALAAMPGQAFDAMGNPLPNYDVRGRDGVVVDASGMIWTLSDDGGGRSTLIRYPKPGFVPEVVHTFEPYERPVAVDVADPSHVWVTGSNNHPPDDYQAWLKRVTLGGGVETVDTGTSNDMALDGQGRLWHIDGEHGIVLRAPDGAAIRRVETSVRVTRLFVDAHDQAWAYTQEPGSNERLIIRLAPDGAVLAHYFIGTDVVITDLEVTPDGTMWVGTTDHGLLRVAIDHPFVP